MSPSQTVQKETITKGNCISDNRSKSNNHYNTDTVATSISSSFSSSSGPQLDYTPPEWVGIPKDKFSLLVLKEGVICEETALVDRP
jgi:hypothetical protein